MRPLISIIIPVWNVDRFLEKCLDSLLAQTYENLQIILIDDGSPDASGEICDRYAEKDKRVEVIHQRNAGVCSARNTGMQYVKGEYIGFVDPDDWAAPDMFEYLYEGLSRTGAEIACCRYYRVAEGEEVYSQCDGRTVLYTGREAVEELVHRFIIRNVFWNKLFKTEIFNGIRFPEGRIYEGTAMVYQLLLRAEYVVLLGDPKYYYLDNPKSYVNDETLKNHTDFVMAHIQRYQDLEHEFPQLREKMMRDLIKGVLKYRYLYRNADEDLKTCEAELESIRRFFDEHKAFITNEMKLGRDERKELTEILRFTEKGFKRARNTGAIAARREQLRRIFKRTPAKAKALPEFAPCERPVYNDINQRILRNLQLCELDILKKVHEICVENGIQYYLYGGTLLGAVRHGGFIPWDDDVDIAMPMKDYRRFLAIAQEQLGEDYFCQTCFNDPDYPKLFMKIRRENSFILEEKWEKKRMHCGIFIDIMPLIGFPDGGISGKLFLHAVSLLQQVCSFEKPVTKRRITKICFRILKKLPLMTRYRLRERLLALSDRFGGGKYVCSYGSHYMPVPRRVLQKQWFTGRETIKFEDGRFFIPDGWKEYLIHIYGEDFMELPPEEKREKHLELTRTVFPEGKVDNKDETL